MATVNKKISLKIIFLGMTLIIYSLYFFLYPIIANIFLMIFSNNYTSKSPIGWFFLLSHLEVPIILPYVYALIFFSINIVIPICNLVAGILILRLSEKGRKCAIISLMVDLISRILFLFILFNKNIRYMYITKFNISVTIVFFSIVLFDLSLIYFLTCKRVKLLISKY